MSSAMKARSVGGGDATSAGPDHKPAQTAPGYIQKHLASLPQIQYSKGRDASAKLRRALASATVHQSLGELIALIANPDGEHVSRLFVGECRIAIGCHRHAALEQDVPLAPVR